MTSLHRWCALERVQWCESSVCSRVWNASFVVRASKKEVVCEWDKKEGEVVLRVLVHNDRLQKDIIKADYAKQHHMTRL